MKKLTNPPTSRQSQAILEETRRLMANRRRPGQRILAELRAFKAARRARLAA